MGEFNALEPIGSLYEMDYGRERKLGFQLETEFPDATHLVEFGVQDAKHPIGCLASSPANLVEIICYCLNPNHYHFVLKQIIEGGISEFMKRISGGYTNYFNTKYQRSGSLFQGPFKAIHIDSNEYLLWLSAYVNANAQIHNITENMKNYPWCSYEDFIGLRNGKLCNKNLILSQFKNPDEYKKFIKDNIPLIQKRKELQKYLLE
jgi:putative transposase